jgi:hypothetical protein
MHEKEGEKKSICLWNMNCVKKKKDGAASEWAHLQFSHFPRICDESESKTPEPMRCKASDSERHLYIKHKRLREIKVREENSKVS